MLSEPEGRDMKNHFAWPYYCAPGGLSFVQNCSAFGGGVKDLPIDKIQLA